MSMPCRLSTGLQPRSIRKTPGPSPHPTHASKRYCSSWKSGYANNWLRFERESDAQTKKPSRTRVFRERCRSENADLGGLRPLGALRLNIADALVFFQRLVAVTFDFREMGEQIFAAVLGHDEAKALVCVKPFHDAGFHSASLSKQHTSKCSKRRSRKDCGQ